MFLGFIVGVIIGTIVGAITVAVLASTKTADIDQRLMLYEMEERRRQAEGTEREKINPEGKCRILNERP